MARTHSYKTAVTWTGNTGAGTLNYCNYERSFELSTAGKPMIPGSSDPAFRGDRTRWNPEELLLGAISACHQLWFLHLCCEAGVSVQQYSDAAEGVMKSNPDGTAEFTSVTLRPRVTVAETVDSALVESLHHAAHGKCVIAQSVKFSVSCEPTTVHDGAPASIFAGSL